MIIPSMFNMPTEAYPGADLAKILVAQSAESARERRRLRQQQLQFEINQKQEEKMNELRAAELRAATVARETQTAQAKDKQAIEIAALERGAAAQTPLTEAPSVPIGSQPLPGLTEEHGAVSPDEASFMGTQTPVPKRMQEITLADGRKIPLAPLQYKEEADREAQEKRYAEAMTSPSVISAQIAAAGKTDNWQHFSRTNPDGSSSVFAFNPKTREVMPLMGGGGGGGGLPNLGLSGEEFLKTMDPGRAEMVRGIAEGRVAPPTNFGRSGPGLQLMQDVMQYDPTADMSKVQARQKYRRERVSGSMATVGGQTRRLGQLAGHLGELEAASKDLEKSGLSDSDYQSWNAVKQALTPSGKGGPLSAWSMNAETVIGEYIAAVTGGRPSNEEERQFALLRDPTVSPKQRTAAIQQLRKLAEDRAQELESTHLDVFGRPSAETDQPLFRNSWEFDTNTARWRMKTGDGKPGDMAPSAPQKLTPPAGLSPEGLAYWKKMHGVQ